MSALFVRSHTKLYLGQREKFDKEEEKKRKEIVWVSQEKETSAQKKLESGLTHSGLFFFLSHLRLLPPPP